MLPTKFRGSARNVEKGTGESRKVIAGGRACILIAPLDDSLTQSGGLRTDPPYPEAEPPTPGCTAEPGTFSSPAVVKSRISSASPPTTKRGRKGMTMRRHKLIAGSHLDCPICCRNQETRRSGVSVERRHSARAESAALCAATRRWFIQGLAMAPGRCISRTGTSSSPGRSPSIPRTRARAAPNVSSPCWTGEGRSGPCCSARNAAKDRRCRAPGCTWPQTS